MPFFLITNVWIVAQVGRDKIPFLPHKNYKLIQLFHGCGPKGILHTEKDLDIYDAWCVPSNFIKQRYIELWEAPPEKIYATGYARMDLLLKYLKLPKKVIGGSGNKK